jgi:hypothetical protein
MASLRVFIQKVNEFGAIRIIAEMEQFTAQAPTTDSIHRTNRAYKPTAQGRR